jgi:hypothetical protein
LVRLKQLSFKQDLTINIGKIKDFTKDYLVGERLHYIYIYIYIYGGLEFELRSSHLSALRIKFLTTVYLTKNKNIVFINLFFKREFRSITNKFMKECVITLNISLFSSILYDFLKDY